MIMEIYHFYEMLTVWFIFIDLKLMILIKAIVLKKSKFWWNLLWWKIIFEMKILHCDEKLIVLRKLKFWWNSLWWKIISEIKILYSDKQKLSLRWKSCIVKEIHHRDKVLLCRASIIVMNIYYYDEYSTMWWKIISIITEIFIEK